jgi:hypothetical protein
VVGLLGVPLQRKSAVPHQVGNGTALAARGIGARRKIISCASSAHTALPLMRARLHFDVKLSRPWLDEVAALCQDR